MGNRKARDIIILAPGTTDSVTSAVFEVEVGEEVVITLYGTTSADTAELQRRDPAGTWVQTTDDNGDIDLSITRAVEVIVAPGAYRLNVPTRTGSWGAAISRA